MPGAAPAGAVWGSTPTARARGPRLLGRLRAHTLSTEGQDPWPELPALGVGVGAAGREHGHRDAREPGRPAPVSTATPHFPRLCCSPRRLGRLPPPRGPHFPPGLGGKGFGTGASWELRLPITRQMAQAPQMGRHYTGRAPSICQHPPPSLPPRASTEMLRKPNDAPSAAGTLPARSWSTTDSSKINISSSLSHWSKIKRKCWKAPGQLPESMLREPRGRGSQNVTIGAHSTQPPHRGGNKGPRVRPPGAQAGPSFTRPPIRQPSTHCVSISAAAAPCSGLLGSGRGASWDVWGRSRPGSWELR